MLRKFIDKCRIIKKVIKGEKGYTLVEVTAVVAITSALAAVIIPVVIDKVEQGKMSVAKQDVASLAGIVQNIFNDTGDYPTRDTPGSANPAYPDKSTSRDDVYDMLITTDPNDSVDETAGDSKGNVTDIVGLDTNGTYIATKDLFAYHAIINGPTDAAVPRYEADEWAGPYMSEDKLDPWGNSYVIYVEPLQEKYRRDLKSGLIGPNASEGPYRSAWVLSGGPNQVIETVITDSSIQSDDIGTKIK